MKQKAQFKRALAMQDVRGRVMQVAAYCAFVTIRGLLLQVPAVAYRS
jgi:hypothetical protein